MEEKGDDSRTALPLPPPPPPGRDDDDDSAIRSVLGKRNDERGSVGYARAVGLVCNVFIDQITLGDNIWGSCKIPALVGRRCGGRRRQDNKDMENCREVKNNQRGGRLREARTQSDPE